ncbi:helix-turn-helix domain-containing protein [Marinobacter salarius]|uniref:helix-turn-helix domain-containing protein n=1 Tax=Marinobacter salarius TaxID=1420917 RepID=UPI0024203303|nr:helix-turn-helix transcriptional regulator [Marinobacter salarius]
MPKRIHHYEHLEPELGDTSHLSPRQREVAELISKGYKSIDIAVELGISLDTVNNHIDALKDKLSAFNKCDLICQMWIHGILERPKMMSLVVFMLCALAALPIGRTTVRAPQGRPKVAQVARVGRHEISGVLS